MPKRLIMADYYIRTPDNADSRGPFDVPRLLTLAEAGQVTEDTLYFDEDKEEWRPIAENEELKAQVFPEVQKLELKINPNSSNTATTDDEEPGVDVDSLLAAAEGATSDTKHRKAKEKSADKAASVAASGLGLVMLASSLLFIAPHLELLTETINAKAYTEVLNYPFLLVGLFDFLMAVFLFLAVTEVYPAIRGRAMIGFGFGAYISWSMGSPILIAAWAAGGIGMFLATLVRTYPLMLLSLLLGIGGNGFLAYLAINGDLSGYFEGTMLNLIQTR